MSTSINQFAVKSNKEKEVDHQWEKDAYHNLLTFTTKDNDNDSGNWGSNDNCAIYFTGVWWYKNCYYSNLNGQIGVDPQGKGVTWNTWRGSVHSLPFTKMKTRCSWNAEIIKFLLLLLFNYLLW